VRASDYYKLASQKTMTCCELKSRITQSAHAQNSPSRSTVPPVSGKSSVARLVARTLGYLYLDSGAMYRALALKGLQRGVPVDDETQLAKLANETHIELRSPTPEQEKAGIKNRVFLDGTEVTEEIRTPEVAQAASRLATIAPVRAVLVAEQQRAGAGGGVVMEGRDNWPLLFFLMPS